MRRGSTFCMGCGSKLTEIDQPMDVHDDEQNQSETHTLETLEEGSADLEFELPDSTLEEVPEDAVLSEPVIEDTEPLESTEEAELPPADDLSWEVDEKLLKAAPEPEEELTVVEVPSEEPAGTSRDISWDEEDLVIEAEEVKEGMPFKEVEPPRVVSGEFDSTTEAALVHLFPDERHTATRDAVAHLFPEGRGVTSKDFIDVVVGKPTKIDVSEPMHELEEPACPSCGTALASDGFVYPDYVFDAMGRARLESGIERMKENMHEKAIESFEMAKKLYERANNEKMVAECGKKIDEGYDAMANEHFLQGEKHRKAEEYEWAIVQFKKAREIYMFSTDVKKRAKCSEKARECYVDWGRVLEDEGDRLAKAGMTRDALAKYQEAARKFREGDDQKKLKDLEKRIMKA
ncbi:MAG: hypothetical protein EAX95_05520 [Candidatus Thorarchaeota archaeon]|nr:hypothetical protein [Candidatus Thorarchaeota archaeon]